jgi:hypothetical protein
MRASIMLALALAAPSVARADALRDSEWEIADWRSQPVKLASRANTRFCLGAPASGPAMSVTMVMRPCAEASLFRVQASDDGTVQFLETRSGLCLGVRGIDSHRPGTDVETFRCAGSARDPLRDGHWRIVPLQNGAFHVRNALSDLCLGVRGFDSVGAGAGVEVYRCSTTPEKG